MCSLSRQVVCHGHGLARPVSLYIDPEDHMFRLFLTQLFGRERLEKTMPHMDELHVHWHMNAVPEEKQGKLQLRMRKED